MDGEQSTQTLSASPFYKKAPVYNQGLTASTQLKTQSKLLLIGELTPQL